MTQDLRVALTTSLNDRLVAPLRRSIDEIEKNLKGLAQDLTQIQGKSEQAGRALGGMKGPERAAKEAAELARTTDKAVGLAQRLEAAWNRAGNVMKGIGAGMAAWQAWKYVVSGPMQQERSYSRQLADLSNVAFADRNKEGRIAGMKSLDEMVTASLRAGGGKREDAVQALSTIMAQGGFTEKQLGAVMPEIMRVSTAANADPRAIAELVGKALKNGFEVADIPDLLGKAIASGQAGGFEMRDMSKWLPKLLAAGSTIGMRGMKDYEEILAMAQTSVTTAGGSDEAGNNLLNFLLKVNSPDTQNDAKKQGVDLTGTLMRARGKGKSSAAAFLELLSITADKDPRMVQLRSQFAAAGNSQDRLASLQSQEALLKGTALGKYLQDRQALMPAIAVLNNPDEMKRQLAAARAGGRQTTDVNFGVVEASSDFRVQQAENEKLFAQSRALEGVNGALAKYAQGTTDLYQRFPAFATAVEAAKLAVTGLAAAAGAAAGLLALLGIGKAGAAAAAAAGSGAAAAGAALPAVTAAGGGATAVAAGGGAAVAGLVAMPATVLGAGVLISEQMNSPKGLMARIDRRNEKLRELQELATLDPANAERYGREGAGLKADRDAMRDRLGAAVGGGRGFARPDPGAEAAYRASKVPLTASIQVTLDGKVIATKVEEMFAVQARRN